MGTKSAEIAHLADARVRTEHAPRTRGEDALALGTQNHAPPRTEHRTRRAQSRRSERPVEPALTAPEAGRPSWASGTEGGTYGSCCPSLCPSIRSDTTCPTVTRDAALPVFATVWHSMSTAATIGRLLQGGGRGIETLNAHMSDAKATTELESVIYEREGPIARIILNQPETANAQSSAMVRDVEACLDDADRDYDVRVLILKANGRGSVRATSSAATEPRTTSFERPRKGSAPRGSRSSTCSSGPSCTCGSWRSR